MSDEPQETGNSPNHGVLYVVATPIGNLEDMTLRALRVLGEVDLIAAEGVEHTRRLCRRYEIGTRLISYNQNNRRRKEPGLLEKLRSGRKVALVTNAGTPGISDPGTLLIRRALDERIRVEAVPGPCAAVAALSVSGLRSDGFLFAGFLPSRSGRRRKEIEPLVPEPRTLVFYEAPHRIRAMLEDLRDVLGDREAVIAREMTKIHEEILRGTLGELAELVGDGRARGEFTVMVEGASGGTSGDVPETELRERIKELLGREDMSLRDVAEKLALEQGLGYRHIYKVCLEIQDSLKTR
ncbi:MAG: 16S rRNA (cytidine(1402)-2'-O)-methyltransferase [Deltaproteobacteria bacterium]|nr:16S rRNA (cytidine(1402)-2'-O)-methyltransferase [Deltaproteobacteria bacterium]